MNDWLRKSPDDFSCNYECSKNTWHLRIPEAQIDASHIQKENRESPSQTTANNSGVLERVFSNKPKARTFHRLVVNSL